jgi:L-histidine N-alpha-methyltransferase
MPRSGLSRTERALDPARAEFASDVRAGLVRGGQKELPSKYLYDELGTALFDAITHLPEYGLTRADHRLLRAHARDVAAVFDAPPVVTELGSGTGQKSRVVLEAIGARPRYYPIDVSADALAACSQELVDIAEVVPVCGSYLDGLAHVTAQRREGETLLVLFLGSTIGNFERPCAREFLNELRDRLQPGDAFLLGADLVKPAAQLLPAYDDPTGVTAAFNLNLLGRVNRELDGSFDLHAFQHEARYNAPERRIEMHLRSTVDQTVTVGLANIAVRFSKDETIWTESSHKFDRAELDRMAGDAGFHVRATWVDEEWPFAETLWIAA